MEFNSGVGFILFQLISFSSVESAVLDSEKRKEYSLYNAEKIYHIIQSEGAEQRKFVF